MFSVSDAMDTRPPKYLSAWVLVQYLDGSNVCCSVESTWLRHLASRGTDNDKTGVLLTYRQKMTEPLFFQPLEAASKLGSQHLNSHSLSLGALPPPFQHETPASLIDFYYK